MRMSSRRSWSLSSFRGCISKEPHDAADELGIRMRRQPRWPARDIAPRWRHVEPCQNAAAWEQNVAQNHHICSKFSQIKSMQGEIRTEIRYTQRYNKKISSKYTESIGSKSAIHALTPMQSALTTAEMETFRRIEAVAGNRSNADRLFVRTFVIR